MLKNRNLFKALTLPLVLSFALVLTACSTAPVTPLSQSDKVYAVQQVAKLDSALVTLEFGIDKLQSQEIVDQAKTIKGHLEKFRDSLASWAPEASASQKPDASGANLALAPLAGLSQTSMQQAWLSLEIAILATQLDSLNAIMKSKSDQAVALVAEMNQQLKDDLDALKALQSTPDQTVPSSKPTVQPAPGLRTTKPTPKPRPAGSTN